MFTVVKLIALGHFSIFRELWFLEPYCSLGTVPWVWLSSSWPYFKTVLANSQTPKKTLLVLVYIWFLRDASKDFFFFFCPRTCGFAFSLENGVVIRVGEEFPFYFNNFIAMQEKQNKEKFIFLILSEDITLGNLFFFSPYLSCGPKT